MSPHDMSLTVEVETLHCRILQTVMATDPDESVGTAAQLAADAASLRDMARELEVVADSMDNHAWLSWLREHGDKVDVRYRHNCMKHRISPPQAALRSDSALRRMGLGGPFIEWLRDQ